MLGAINTAWRPLALVLFLAQPSDAFAAEQPAIQPDGSTQVVGTVRDTTGLPLPGATNRAARSDSGVEPVGSGRYRVTLKVGGTTIVSRGRAQALKRLIL